MIKIVCSKCGFEGSINDKLIPEGGKNVTCPKCKSKFFVSKEENIAPTEEITTYEEEDIVSETENFEDQQKVLNVPPTNEMTQKMPTKKIDTSLTRVSAILASSICIITGLYLLTVQPASEDGNIMFTICHGMGAYFIAKGFFVGPTLWNLANLRENK